MKCLVLLRQKEISASNRNLRDDPLAPFFTALRTALPLLEETLRDLRGNEETTRIFQALATEIVTYGEYTAENLHRLAEAYAQTHGCLTDPDRKPVIEIAEHASVMLEQIDATFEAFNKLLRSNDKLNKNTTKIIADKKQKEEEASAKI